MKHRGRPTNRALQVRATKLAKLKREELSLEAREIKKAALALLVGAQMRLNRADEFPLPISIIRALANIM